MKTKLMCLVLILFFVSFGIAVAGEKQLTFEWEQSSDDLPENGGDLDHWELFSTTDNGLPFEQWTKEGDVQYNGQGSPATSDFTITAPDGQVTNFWFKMTAVDDAGNPSDPSDYQEGHPTSIDFKPPPAPVLAQPTYNNQTKTITLTWTQDDPDGDVANWRVFYSATSGGPYTDLGEGTSPFDHVVPSDHSGKWAYYVVVAFDNSGNFSPNSNEMGKKLSMGVPFNLKVTVSSDQ